MKLTSALVLCLVLAGCVWRGEDSVRFKFQTSGASLDAVPVYDYVVQGLVLKPATPSDAKIHRDAQNNALVEWRRRGRINYHWRDRAGVPVSEENEYYEIESYNGSTLVNTYRVPIAEAQPIQWEIVDTNGATDSPVLATDGSGTIHRIPSSIAPITLRSKQEINGAFVLEFEPYSDGTIIYPMPSFTAAIGPTTASSYVVQYLGGPTNFEISLSNAAAYVLTVASGDRFVAEYRDGFTKYFKNPNGSTSPTVAIDNASHPGGPYRISLNLSGSSNQGIRNPKLLRLDTPDWTYTAAMQTADGLTPGNPIRLKLYMVSAQVGRGIPLDFTG